MSIFQTLKNLLEELNNKFSKLTKEHTAEGWASLIVPLQAHLLSSGYCCICKVDEVVVLIEGTERLGFTSGAAGTSRLNTLLLVGVGLVTALGVNFAEVDSECYL